MSLIYLIPIVAILAGMFSEYLKFKGKQAQLGASTEQVGDDLKQLRAELAGENERLRRRVENLEAIVTSKSWDQITGDPLGLVASADNLRVGRLEFGDEDASEVARLARRTQT